MKSKVHATKNGRIARAFLSLSKICDRIGAAAAVGHWCSVVYYGVIRYLSATD